MNILAFAHGIHRNYAKRTTRKEAMTAMTATSEAMAREALLPATGPVEDDLGVAVEDDEAVAATVVEDEAAGAVDDDDDAATVCVELPVDDVVVVVPLDDDDDDADVPVDDEVACEVPTGQPPAGVPPVLTGSQL